MKQVTFKDIEDTIFGGIQLDNGDVICGCCGCIFSADEIGDISKGAEIEIEQVFDFWVDLSEEIKGD